MHWQHALPSGMTTCRHFGSPCDIVGLYINGRSSLLACLHVVDTWCLHTAHDAANTVFVCREAQPFMPPVDPMTVENAWLIRPMLLFGSLSLWQQL